MSVPNVKIESIQFISSHLRVPEYKYEKIGEDECSALVEEFCNRYQIQENSHNSLNELRLQYFADKQFPTRFLNLVFLFDRCFDVWLRKSFLDPLLKQQLARWRLLLLRNAYFKHEQTSLAIGFIIDLLDEFAGVLKAWCANPARAQKMVPDLLASMMIELSGGYSGPVYEKVRAQWDEYKRESEAKAAKISERLIEKERLFIAQRYCDALAQSYLNKLFKHRKLTPNLQDFLAQTWVKVLSSALEQSLDTKLPDTLNLISKKLRAVYCDKGKAAFQYGETLIEELEATVKSFHLGNPEETWELLAGDAISILKGETLQEQEFTQIERFEQMEHFAPVEKPGFKEGDLFLSGDSQVRYQVLKFFNEYAQVLLVNYLGMKLEICTCLELSERIKSRQMQRVAEPIRFSKVMATSLSGLGKVAETQQAARERAAEKALVEAQKIRLEQEKADQEARQQAKEIARRTKDLANKKEEAKRLEAEKNALVLLSALKLGAWVAIIVNGEKQRYKLAVKFAARKRYVFVDKYGVKKIEYNEESLVADLLGETLEILSDGADFDESLERVIGRMRMSR